MPGDAGRATADRLVALLGDDLDHAGPDTSFSPFWSNVGLGFALPSPVDATPGLASNTGFAGGPAAARGAPARAVVRGPGIATLYLHLNRVTRALGAPFLDAPGRLVRESRAALSVEQDLGAGRLRVAFCAPDTFVVEAAGVAHARLAFLDDPELRGLRVERRGAERRYLAQVATLDARDPDPALPLAVGARLAHGAWDDTGVLGRLRAADDGAWRLIVTVALLEVDDARIDAALDAAPGSFEEARDRSRRWLAGALGGWRLPQSEPEAERLAAKAAYALLANGANRTINNTASGYTGTRTITCNNSSLSQSGGSCTQASGSQTYTAPGTYTFVVPPHSSLIVELWGAGAGGSGKTTDNSNGAGKAAGNPGGHSMWHGGHAAGRPQADGGIAASTSDRPGGVGRNGDINLTGGVGYGDNEGSPTQQTGGEGAGPGGGARTQGPNPANGNSIGGGGSGRTWSASGKTQRTAGGSGGGYTKKTYAAGTYAPGTSVTVVVGKGGLGGGARPGGTGADGQAKISWQ